MTSYDAVCEKAKTEDALKDLEHIEQEVVAEAEASVADYDAMGDETAFDFDGAQQATAGR